MTRREEIAAARARVDEAELKRDRLEFEFSAADTAVAAAQNAVIHLAARAEDAARELIKARGERVARHRELEELLAKERAPAHAFPFFVVSRPSTTFLS